MRVSGKMKIVEDMGVKKKCIAERPFLKKMGITEPDDPLHLNPACQKSQREQPDKV